MFARENASFLRLTFFILLSITLMVIDKRHAALQQFRAALSLPIAPIQLLVNWPVNMVNEFGGIIRSYDRVLNENLTLKGEQLLLKAEMQRLLAIEVENNQLKALLRSSQHVQGNVLVANLLSVDSGSFSREMVIDKGLKDKLYLGQPVLDAKGVMGQIIDVGPLTSRVLLVSDAKSGVPVQVTRNGLRAVAVGDPINNNLKLLHVPQTADVQEGDVLVTSGLGENFQQGYPVGKIIYVEKDPSMQFATVKVEPSAQLDRNRQVLLVWTKTLQNVKG